MKFPSSLCEESVALTLQQAARSRSGPWQTVTNGCIRLNAMNCGAPRFHNLLRCIARSDHGKRR